MYFPLLKAPRCNGVTTLSNFPPNNWELGSKQKQGRFVHLTYSNGNVWESKFLHHMNDDIFSTICHSDYKDIIPDTSVALLSINDSMLPEVSSQLPVLSSKITRNPSWRAELGLLSENTKTSYMGEAFPFHTRASLLTFAPFLQFGKGISNYVLLMNVEMDALHRVAMVSIFDANDRVELKTESVTSNQINIIPLDGLGFNAQSLPVITSKDMAFVPIYFSISKDGNFMSMEHSHPPSNMAVLGQRFKIQNYLKDRWFSWLGL